MGEQLSGAAGVLASDHVGGAQRLDGARREIAEVADGRGDEHDHGTRTSSWSPGCNRHRSNAPALRLDHGARRDPGPAEAMARHAHGGEHNEVAIAEGNVDREAHADGVHRPGRGQQQRAVDAVASEQALEPRAEGVGHFDGRQHLAVAHEPGH